MHQNQSFNRMPRIQEPLPGGEIKIPGPPNITPLSKFSWFQTLLPVAGIFVMVGVYGGMRGDWMMAIPMVAMSGFSVIGSIVGTTTQRKNHQKQTEEKEAEYVAVLNQKQNGLNHLRQEQQRIRTNTNPNLATLVIRARNRDPHLWERRPQDDDFLHVRLGIGNLSSSVSVSAPHPDMPDPRLQQAHMLESEYAIVPQVPVTADIRTGPLGIAGSLADRTGLARAFMCNLVVHHSPDEVHLLAIYSSKRAREWQWLKWLPHTYALNHKVTRHYLANDSRSAENVLKELLEELHRRQNQLYATQHSDKAPTWPWIVVLVEDYDLVRNDPAIHLLLSIEGRQLNATAIFMVKYANQTPMGCQSVVQSPTSGQLWYSVAGTTGGTSSCLPEYADAPQSEQLARSLASIHVHTIQSDTAMPSTVRLFNMLGVKDITRYDIASSWRDRASDKYLKVPIGERRGNQAMILDLNHTGHGPHGLIAGTTGSGKSELVQTLVVALAMAHHPYDVGFVLVDFKGGGTFSELVNLPHTLGMVTDLSGNLTTRAQVALKAETDRRKRMFNAAGVSDIGDYQDMYWQEKVEEPLPRLVVIIDEFAELVSDYPEFMDELIAIARIGRSLGVHLILATQSPAGVVKQQIWANAKFRICLRVESRNESQEMLHRPEAANLPRMPGRGYLQVGNNDVFELFQVARVAGRYRIQGNTDTLIRKREEHIVITEISPLGQRRVRFDSKKQEQQRQSKTSTITDIDVTIKRLVNEAQQMDIEKLPSPWPDPLPDHIALPNLLLQEQYVGWNGNRWVFERDAPVTQPSRTGFCHHCEGPLRETAKFCNACGEPITDTPAAPASPPPNRPPTLPNRPWLGAISGLLDDPGNQRQLPLLLELAQQDGQLIVIGSPGSGKEMWVRTLVTSLARTHTPDELHFYLLEFGGQALKVFENLPHVGGIFTPLDEERVRRLLLLLLDSLEERKHLCNQFNVDGLVRLRERRPQESPPAIVILVTGFIEFRQKFQDEILYLTRLIREGGPYGIHIVLTGDRAGDIPTAVTSVIARRVVLRLADADEYSIVIGTRLRPSKDQKFPPGRGWYGRPPLEFQTATPGYKENETEQLTELQQLVHMMQQAWHGPRPDPVEILPDTVPLRELLSRIPDTLIPLPQPQLAIPIGLDGVRMQMVLVDLVKDGPNFLIASVPQGGKTTLLSSWTMALAEFNSPRQVQFVLVAGRRNSLSALAGLPHVLDYCLAPEGFCRENGPLAHLLAEIERRDDLLTHDSSISIADEWPHIVVMIDDYDEFSTATSKNSATQDDLATLVKRGRDVNVHTIVAGPLPNLGAEYNDMLVKQLKGGHSGFLLRILDASEQNPLGLRIRASEIGEMPPGRGFLVRNGIGQMLHTATPGDSTAVFEWGKEILQQWIDADIDTAAWPEEIPAEETEEENKE